MQLRFRKSLALAGLAFSLGSALIFSMETTARAEAQVVTELDATEPFEAMAFHGGVLWVGNSRQMMSSVYKLQVFSPQGQLLTEQGFPHSQTYIYPYDSRSVIVVGVKAQPNLTHYSIVSYNGPNRPLTIRTQAIPVQAWAYQWLGTIGSKEFFFDLSGLVDDPERERNPNLPARTLFSMQSGRAVYTQARVRMPIEGIKVNDSFFVLHREAIGAPQSSLVKVDSRNFSVREVFAEKRNLLMNVAFVPAVNLLALTEAGSNQLLLVDPNTFEIKFTYPIEGKPRSIAVVGHCVAVGSEESKKVALINVSGEPDLIDSADLSGVGEVFRGIRKLVVDRESQQVFGRSAYACNPLAEACDKTHNSIVAARLKMNSCFE